MMALLAFLLSSFVHVGDPPGRIVYLEDADDHPHVSRRLVVWSASERQVLAENLLWSFDAHDYQHLAVSPSHEFVAVNAVISKRRSHPNVSLGLYVVPLETGELIPIADRGENVHDMEFDGEGKRIAFHDGRKAWVYEIEADETTLYRDFFEKDGLWVSGVRKSVGKGVHPVWLR